MTPPKRALFSLNLDSNTDHVHQRVEDHNKEGSDRVRILDTKGPTHNHSDFQYVAKPFEKAVDRAVNDVVKGTGKKVHTADGTVSYSSSSRSTERRSDSRVNVVSKKKRRDIEAKYDTSEL